MTRRPLAAAPDTNVTRLAADWIGLDVVDLTAPDTGSWRALCAEYRHQASFVCLAAATGPQAEWWETAEPTRQHVETIFGVRTGAVIEGRRVEGGLLLVTGYVGVWRDAMTAEQRAHLVGLRLPGVRVVEPNGRSPNGSPPHRLRFTPPAATTPDPGEDDPLARLWRDGW